MNGPVIFLEKGTKVHQNLRGTNLETIYEFSEISCVIPNKAAYMDYKTWANLVKVVAPGTRKMKMSNVALVFPVFFYIFNCTSLFLQILFR